MLLYASALEGIPAEIMEAAGIDGAGAWYKLRYITLPLIREAIATDMLLITLATLSDFTLVYVLTGGSNANSELLTIYQYRQAFQFYQIGYGSAIALLIIAVGAILSLLYIRTGAYMQPLQQEDFYGFTPLYSSQFRLSCVDTGRLILSGPASMAGSG
jgi:multiple sugar transport system permease protein